MGRVGKRRQANGKHSEALENASSTCQQPSGPMRYCAGLIRLGFYHHFNIYFPSAPCRVTAGHLGSNPSHRCVQGVEGAAHFHNG